MTGLFAKIKKIFVRWLGRKLPGCDYIVQTISEGMDRKLTFGEQIKLKLHLKICRWCQRYLEQVYLIHDAAHKFSDDLEDPISLPTDTLSLEAQERLKRLLESPAEDH